MALIQTQRTYCYPQQDIVSYLCISHVVCWVLMGHFGIVHIND
jgi:hypothetical protein